MDQFAINLIHSIKMKRLSGGKRKRIQFPFLEEPSAFFLAGERKNEEGGMKITRSNCKIDCLAEGR